MKIEIKTNKDQTGYGLFIHELDKGELLKAVPVFLDKEDYKKMSDKDLLEIIKYSFKQLDK